MPRYRLRYQATDFEIPPGEFVVGRSSACSLALDDGLVSRRHAIFHVGDTVVLEDLGSRNGVAVNGERVEGRRTLNHLDRVTVGSQELVLLVGRGGIESATLQLRACSFCKALNDMTTAHCASCGTRLDVQPSVSSSATLQNLPAAEIIDEPTQMGSAFRLLAGIADKAFALKRFDEAERVLVPSLDHMERAIAEGVHVADITIEDGLKFALRLAEGPRARHWLGWIFRVYGSLGRWMDVDRIESLHQLVRASRYADPRPLREYLDRLRSGPLRPAQRFLVKRLESLERVISA